MKKLFLLFASALILSSCGGHKYSGANGEKTQIDAEKEFKSLLTDSDSTSLVALSNDFMGKVAAGQVAEAVDMLYALHQNQIYYKSDSYSADLLERFDLFTGWDYVLDYVNFSTQGINDVCYKVTLHHGDDSRTLKFTLNPVLIDGVWYLVLKDGDMPSKVISESKKIHDLAPAPEEITLHKRPVEDLD